MKKLIFVLLILSCSLALAIDTSTESTVTASTTSSTVLAAANRQDAVIVNTGAVACYLARGATAISGRGIYLAASGGYYNIDANNLYKGVITCITPSSTTTLVVSEGK